MDQQIDSSRLQAIAAMLTQEICRPIEDLQANLLQLLEDPDKAASPTEQTHARTMLELCDDLRRLTEGCLGPGLLTSAGSEATAGAIAPSMGMR